MSILSDNPELLNNLYNDMKENQVDIRKVTKKETGAQDIIGTLFALDITYERVAGYIEFLHYVKVYSPYLLKTMYVETRDGEKIPYLEYDAFSDEEKANFFRNENS